jgi:hypothetical protein
MTFIQVSRELLDDMGAAQALQVELDRMLRERLEDITLGPGYRRTA